ncbi:sigma-54 interaction domain-containing protein [Acidobacteriota bacterium]
MSADGVLLHLCGKEKRDVYRGNSSDLSKERKESFFQGIELVLEKLTPVVLSPQEGIGFSVFEGNSGNNNSYSVLCHPVLEMGGPLGAVCLERHSKLGPFTEKNLDLMLELTKPLRYILKSYLKEFRAEDSDWFFTNTALAGTSEMHRRVLNLIARVKNTHAPVFIGGESGTGKELVARTIHDTGQRKHREFVAVNCGAIPDNLLESEFFGHVKGAFTGSTRDKPGLVEEADGGTFFLDEIGDLSLSLQSKLLRLLQEKEFRRVGDNRIRQVDVRFISATNKNIELEVSRRRFREDLYYRLKIITIEIPPLRERKEDILCLINRFLEKYSREMLRERTYFSPRSLELLVNYSWPGNVRELQNEIQRCLILCGEEDLIREEYLSPKINPDGASHSPVSYNYFLARAEFEKRFLNQALARLQYNRAKTAEQVGLSRQGLFKLIKKHNITVPSERRSSLG